MLEKINNLRSKIVNGLEVLERKAAEKHLQRKQVGESYRDSLSSLSFIREKYEELQERIESYGDKSVCPECGGVAEKHLAGLKAKLSVMEAEYTRLHEESELLAERLQDIDIEINDLETQIHSAIRNNRKVESEIASLMDQAGLPPNPSLTVSPQHL